MYTSQGIDTQGITNTQVATVLNLIRARKSEGQGDSKITSELTLSGYSKAVVKEALARYYASPGTYKAPVKSSGGGWLDSILGFLKPSDGLQQQPFIPQQDQTSVILPIVLIGGLVAAVVLLKG